MSTSYADLTQSFEALDLDASTFRHIDHIGVACEMLCKYDFMEAAGKYAKNIDAIATKAGAATKFNTTITLVFMSLIAERMQSTPHTDFDDFISKNQDLLSNSLLRKWYSSERLQSDLARDIFLMPDAARSLGHH